MKEIITISGDVVMVDDCDYDLLSQRRWRTRRIGRHVYAAAFEYSNGGEKLIYMHRLIMDPGAMEVDHISGDGLDNRRANLRNCTHSENMHNRRKDQRKVNCSSKYKGVAFKKKSGKFESRIIVDSKLNHLGTFINEEDAARAYDNAAKDRFGEFAKTNEMMGLYK